MSNDGSLIGGEALKAAAEKYKATLLNQAELPGIFDKWFMRVVARLAAFDPAQNWEQSIGEEISHLPQHQARALEWDFVRLRLFLDRWSQGRFVDYERRRRSGVHYSPKYGAEFGGDVLLTCQGAPSFMQWRERPLMKTVFDFALYPQLIAELKPQTVFEIGSGSGASAIWFADLLVAFHLKAHVYSVDIVPLKEACAGVTFFRGDCAHPETLFDANLLKIAPHPWLVIEDAHHNVEAVINHMHGFMKPGDYLVVEDSEIKQDELHRFIENYPGYYEVDTKYTDFFGRNATCALDSIFMRVT